jgi:hypothetical protein
MTSLKSKIKGKLTFSKVLEESGEIRFWDENERRGIKGNFDPTRTIKPTLVDNSGHEEELEEAEFIALCDHSYKF